MSWNCRLIECTPDITAQTLKIGDMFFFDEAKFPNVEDDPENPDADDPYYWFRMFVEPNKLSDFYQQNNSHRPPLLVWLPGRTLFCVDSKCWNSGGYYGGWQVTGDAPCITVSPSIDIGGSYHGFLQNGVIGDDVAGLKFDDSGHIIRG